MTTTLTAPAESSLFMPSPMGIQAMPKDGETIPGAFHFIANCDFFEVDISDNDAIAEACKHMVSYESHELLIQALLSGEIDIAIIAVDNNNSGRVVSAIEALRGKNLSIIGKTAIAADQYILLPQGVSEDDVEQVASQKPALDQAKPNLPPQWTVLERPDTVGSAIEVAAAHRGIINAAK
ncbi:hypothetical protein IPL68_01440 [Candidatus Saccharibacteria bacterium]|nr:MAG: hypothetical protein IPL68_01440 [Candidatus Saccharibacteria bacterium]